MGGGVLQGYGAVLNLRNSIIAGNRIGFGSSGTDCNGTITSQGGNVLQDPSTCTFTPAAADVIGQPGGMGTLAQNGGPTVTHALLLGSPAIDRGGTGCAASDQRGVPRAGACDSGAYELTLCQSILVNTVGTEGADVLTGTEGADGVLALGGNDKVSTLGGNDGVCAGSGNDTAAGGGGRDRLNGEAGKDKLRGQGGNDRLKGGPGKDLCVGGGGKDRAACETEKSV
jgi:Ca2+-binding RTX toxin-like protein